MASVLNCLVSGSSFSPNSKPILSTIGLNNLVLNLSMAFLTSSGCSHQTALSFPRPTAIESQTAYSVSPPSLETRLSEPEVLPDPARARVVASETRPILSSTEKMLLGLAASSPSLASRSGE